MAIFDPDRAAAIMYPDMAAPIAPQHAQAPAPASVPHNLTHATDPAEVTADEVGGNAEGSSPPLQPVDEEPETLAERMYQSDGTPPVDGNYLPMVRDAFEREERDARQAGNEEEVRVLQEGRQQVVEVMQDLGVGGPGARELSRTFAQYRDVPMSDDALEDANARTMRELKEAWGGRFEKNLAHARRAYEAAAKRLPWLAGETENGAGSDVRVIKHFAAIGRRLASKTPK